MTTEALIREFAELELDALDDAGGYPLALGWMGTTVAVAEGYSELYHIDYNDHAQGYSFSFSVVRPEKHCSVELQMPMLHLRTPYEPGVLFGFQAGDQLHRVVRRTGSDADRANRLNFTIFTDHNTATDMQRLM